MMQVCTVAWGHPVFTESGRPLRPSQTTKNTSDTPRLRSSVRIAREELCRFPAANPHARDDLVAIEVHPDRGMDRPVVYLAVADLDHDRVDDHRHVDRAVASGRAHQVCISSRTRSVIREMVSLYTLAP